MNTYQKDVADAFKTKRSLVDTDCFSIVNITSEEQSKQIQDILFKIGYQWGRGGQVYKYLESSSLHPGVTNGRICYGPYTTIGERSYAITAEDFLKPTKLVSRRRK